MGLISMGRTTSAPITVDHFFRFGGDTAKDQRLKLLPIGHIAGPHGYLW
jgi:hypothetical protein